MVKDPNTTNKKRVKLFETFTKLWVTILLIIALIDLQLSYFLAFIGREQIAESLSVAIVTEIIGIVGVYMIRAYFDTYSEKKHELELSKSDETIINNATSKQSTDDEDVG